MKRIITITFTLLIIFSGTSFALSKHWTAEVIQVTAHENGSAAMTIKNPRGNSSTTTFPCDNYVVYLGVKDSPVAKELLSVAMMAYSTNKPIRFGVRKSGGFCEVYYITNR